MNILYCINTLADYGIGYIAEQQIKGLRRLGHGVTVFQGGAMPDEEFDRRVCFIVSNEYRDYDVAVIWANHGLQTMEALRRRGTPVVLVRASTHVEHQNKVLSKELGRQAISGEVVERQLKEYDLCSVILTPSDFAANTFPRYLQGKLRVVPFGVDLDMFKPCIRAPGREFVVGFVGCNMERKGLSHLRHAVAMLQRQGGSAKDLPPPLPLPLPLPLRLRVANGSTRFLEMPQFYHFLDVFCLPSIEEGNSLAVNEALASGVPVLITEACGPWPGFVSGKHGWVIEPRSEHIASMLYHLMTNPRKLHVAGREARRLAEQYPWESHVSQLDKVLTEITR